MEIINSRPSTTFWSIILISCVFGLLVFAVYTFLPVSVDWSMETMYAVGVDWKGAFRPATLALWAGDDPYHFAVFNPPWTFLLLTPVAFLPPNLGAAVMFVLGLFLFALAAYRTGAPPLLMALFVLSPYVIMNSKNGNFDWMVALGATLPPQVGLFLVLSKPQLGIGIAVFWLVEAWRRGRLREVIRVFGPVGAAFLISVLVYGWWPLKSMSMNANPWNASLFPIGLIIGAALLVSAFRTRQSDLSIIASPFLAPYISGHGWSIALFGLIRRRAEFIIVVIVAWLIEIFYAIL